MSKRSFDIEAGGPDAFVPEGKIWKVGSLSPRGDYQGTADLYIEGQIFIGAESAYTIGGKFDICINNRQTSPIWILEGSKVSVGDSRGGLTIEEYDEDAAWRLDGR